MQDFNLTPINSIIKHKATGAEFIFKGWRLNNKVIELFNPRTNKNEHYDARNATKYFIRTI